MIFLILYAFTYEYASHLYFPIFFPICSFVFISPCYARTAAEAFGRCADGGGVRHALTSLSWADIGYTMQCAAH